MTNCGFPPLELGLCPGLIPACCCCCLGNGVMEMLGVDPLDFDFDELAFVNDGRNEFPAAAAAAGFSIASF